ncbi:MAG: hypothetical protein IJO68_00965 [Clostridia bacterium]|nr:hypothetical protein [Clostridia bacterium]
MDIFNIIATVVSLISLVILIYQSINLKDTISSQIYQNFVANSLEIDRILIERPYLRKYVYYGDEVDDNTENIDEIMSFMELIVDITENVEVYKKYIPRSRKKGWLRFVYDVKHTPAYEYYMKKHQLWYEVKE